MFGLKKLGDEKMLAVFTAPSVALLVFGILLNPDDAVSVITSLVWIGGALILLGLFTVSATELAKRLFGGRSSGGAKGE